MADESLWVEEVVDRLEWQVHALSLAIRWGLTVAIVLQTLWCTLVLAQASTLEVIFEGLFGEQGLPAATQFVINSGSLITIAVGALSVGAIASMFVCRRRVWPVALGVFAAITPMVVTHVMWLAIAHEFAAQ